MKRTYEPVDLMVAVGLFATVLSGYFLFISTSGVGILETTPQENPQISRAGGFDFMQAMDWVQPALGQAIVDSSVLDYRAKIGITRSAVELNRATLVDHRLQTAPFGQFDHVRTHADQMAADHQARVQHVMGRTIVNFTERGVRTGALSPATTNGAYNRHLITVAKSTGDRMNLKFADTWQEALGREIVGAGQAQVDFAGQTQERMGSAIVQMARTQQGYQDANADLQGQLAATAIASIHTEMQADRFAKLAEADRFGPGPAMAYSAPKSWPDIPMGTWFGAATILVGLFLAGLTMPAFRPEAPEAAEYRPAQEAEPYRKTG